MQFTRNKIDMNFFVRSRLYILACLLLMLSCATVGKGWNEPIQISTPTFQKNIRITIQDMNDSNNVIGQGEAPFSIKVKTGAGYFRAAKYRVIAENELGVKTEKVIMPTLRWEYYILGNILLGGLIGLLIVDPMTGAMYGFDSPQNIRINNPSTEQSKKDIRELRVLTIKDISKALFF